ncbi:MAG: hypothetical protein KF779_18255 [Hyphomonadaceae bacterium]|nr:hypothetical protein [Hyphomonadaceae bacterium]MCC6789840.1 hypothetical protein [Hyphomonadaceae bacterium]
MKLRTQPEPISGGGALNAALVSAGAHPNGPQRSGGRRQPLRGGAGAASSAYSPEIGFAMCGER